MRHLKSGRKLKRTASHRKATLSALSVALITHKKIRTTVAKAKETRRVVERLITRAKNAVARETGKTLKDVHARRETFSFLHDRKAVSSLFNDIAPKVASRAGGYTRVVSLASGKGMGRNWLFLSLWTTTLRRRLRHRSSRARPQNQSGNVGHQKPGPQLQSRQIRQKPVK